MICIETELIRCHCSSTMPKVLTKRVYPEQTLNYAIHCETCEFRTIWRESKDKAITDFNQHVRTMKQCCVH